MLKKVYWKGHGMEYVPLINLCNFVEYCIMPMCNAEMLKIQDLL